MPKLDVLMSTRLADPFDWFLESIAVLKPNSTSKMRAWGYASEHLRGSKGTEEYLGTWKTWVEWCLEEASGASAKKPLGILILRLRDTAPESIQGVLSASRRGRPSSPMGTSQREAIAERRRLRLAGLREPSMPSSTAMHGLRCANAGMSHQKAFRLVLDEWEAQGRPYPETFDWGPLGLGKNPKAESTA